MRQTSLKNPFFSECWPSLAGPTDTLVEGWFANQIVLGTFTLSNPEGDAFSLAVDDPRFGGRATATLGQFELFLLAGTNIDFEQESSIDVAITATETGDAAQSGQTFTVNVTDVNRESIYAGVGMAMTGSTAIRGAT